MNTAFDIVIFGGFGDLALRKLLPALYRLEVSGKLPAPSRILLASSSAGAPGKFAPGSAGGAAASLRSCCSGCCCSCSARRKAGDDSL